MDLTCSHVKDAVGEEERIQVDLFDLAGSVLDHCSKAGLFLGGGRGWFSCAYKSSIDTILVYEVCNSLKNAHALIKNTCCEVYFNKNK